jgi:predicted nucleotidyltransferase
LRKKESICPIPDGKINTGKRKSFLIKHSQRTFFRENKVMRMPPNYQTTITETAKKVFGESVSVWLFGSRLDDSAKGGDVDLLVQLEKPIADKAVLSARYNAMLQMKLGLQKFDILVVDPSTPLQHIHHQALLRGVRL